MKEKIELPFELPKKLARELLGLVKRKSAIEETLRNVMGITTTQTEELAQKDFEFWEKLKGLYILEDADELGSYNLRSNRSTGKVVLSKSGKEVDNDTKE